MSLGRDHPTAAQELPSCPRTRGASTGLIVSPPFIDKHLQQEQAN